MCGRLKLTTPADVVAAVFAVDAVPVLPPRYNVAPTQPLAVVLAAGGRRRFGELRWGLVPHWADSPAIGSRLINARAESLEDKPAFRDAFRDRRCLVVADGFYEWQTAGRTRRPHLVQRRDRRPFALAGLWEVWRKAGGEPLATCTIVTTAADDLLRPLHDRMPVVIAPEDFDVWLGCAAVDTVRLKTLLTPRSGDSFEVLRVTTHVNDVRNDDPRCSAPEADLFALAPSEAGPKT